MDQRLFLLDKNYILKQAQEDLKAALQLGFIEKLKEGYFRAFNPLGLPDSASEKIRHYQARKRDSFGELYEVLCGIYRYQIGDNQLELLFDGSSHYDKYVKDWQMVFEEWMDVFCQNPNFVIAGLELSVFYNPEKRIALPLNRMKLMVYEHFGLKLYKHKGIQVFKTA